MDTAAKNKAYSKLVKKAPVSYLQSDLTFCCNRSSNSLNHTPGRFQTYLNTRIQTTGLTVLQTTATSKLTLWSCKAQETSSSGESREQPRVDIAQLGWVAMDKVSSLWFQSERHRTVSHAENPTAMTQLNMCCPTNSSTKKERFCNLSLNMIRELSSSVVT